MYIFKPICNDARSSHFCFIPIDSPRRTTLTNLFVCIKTLSRHFCVLVLQNKLTFYVYVHSIQVLMVLVRIFITTFRLVSTIESLTDNLVNGRRRLTRTTSCRTFGSDRSITEWTVLMSTEKPSLWKTIITDVEGRFSG